jgi:hypothetical protein
MATVSVAVRITRRLKPGWDFGAMRHGEAVASAVCCGSVSSPRSIFSQMWLFGTLPVEPPSPALGANLALLVGLQLDRSYAVSMLVE